MYKVPAYSLTRSSSSRQCETNLNHDHSQYQVDQVNFWLEYLITKSKFQEEDTKYLDEACSSFHAIKA
jgi:hypothetical protein